MVVTYRRAKRKGAVKGASPGGKPPITCKTQKIFERDFKAMKKIFAIALALVMVCSMAVALASPCSGPFDWTKAADANKCGKITVEVVPYIKVNDGCGGVEYKVSTCAAAVKTERVYYALKLTAEANLDAEWLAKAELKMGLSGLKDNVITDKMVIGMNGVDTTKDKQVVYYLRNDLNVWVDETTDDFDIKDYIFNNTVTDARKAKVCVTVKSENAFTEGIVGDYYVVYDAGKAAVAGETKTEILKPTAEWLWQNGLISLEEYALYLAKDNKDIYNAWTGSNVNAVDVEKYAAAKAKVDKLLEEYVTTKKEVKPGTAAIDGTIKVYDKKGGTLLVTYTIKDDKIYKIDYTQACGKAQYETIKAFFGLDINTTITSKLIKKNFGWDDEVKHCFQWSKNASAIVDPECKIEIPKTGDVSVVAYAVMALVAAAGAMGLKK